MPLDARRWVLVQQPRTQVGKLRAGTCVCVSTGVGVSKHTLVSTHLPVYDEYMGRHEQAHIGQHTSASTLF